MVLSGQHGRSTRIKGVRDSGIERFHGIPSRMICGLPLSNYQSLTSLGNTEYLNVVYVVVSDPMIAVLGCLVVYF